MESARPTSWHPGPYASFFASTTFNKWRPCDVWQRLVSRFLPRLDRLSLAPDYIVRYGSGDDSGDAAGYNGMKRLLALNPRPDGVFCCNDPIAMGAMKAILDAGLRIPQDVAIVGCGNVHYDDLLLVPLTSIDQDTNGLDRMRPS